MKKLYQNPEIKVVKMEVTHLCEPSAVQMYGKDATSGAMSRDGSSNFWDDDEDY